MKTITDILDRLSQPITCKADIKRITTACNRVWEREIRNTIHRNILNIQRELVESGNERDEQLNDDYWNMPSELHRLREKHFSIVERHAPGLVDDARTLVDAYAAAKSATIVAKEQTETVEQQIIRDIKAEMERRKTNVLNQIDMSRKFGMSVWANAHYVNHPTAGRIIRVFYYLNGKLTALSTICGIAQLIEDEAKQKGAA